MRFQAIFGFNEAAADDRGKRGRAAAGLLRDRASMRPRPMTAENLVDLAEGDRGLRALQ